MHTFAYIHAWTGPILLTLNSPQRWGLALGGMRGWVVVTIYADVPVLPSVLGT